MPRLYTDESVIDLVTEDARNASAVLLVREDVKLTSRDTRRSRNRQGHVAFQIRPTVVRDADYFADGQKRREGRVEAFGLLQKVAGDRLDLCQPQNRHGVAGRQGRVAQCRGALEYIIPRYNLL